MPPLVFYGLLLVVVGTIQEARRNRRAREVADLVDELGAGPRDREPAPYRFQDRFDRIELD